MIGIHPIPSNMPPFIQQHLQQQQIRNSTATTTTTTTTTTSISSSISSSIIGRSAWVEGAIIVGAGPSGLAVAACLKDRGISSVVLDKADCIASLWQHRTYDRLHLHISKEFCELPLFPFPSSAPLYPNKHQFLDYLHDYATHFGIQPLFNRCVASAAYDPSSRIWRVHTVGKNNREEFLGRWLVVATGENAEARIPNDLPGLETFQGCVLHSSMYTNGTPFANKKVLVVGSGNSGMEIAFDLLDHDATPSIIVRSPMHILPKEMFGRSTFAVAMLLMKLLPLPVTDRLLLLYAFFAFGNTKKYGIHRPQTGPLETKAKFGKTPILDMGAFEKIKSGSIKVKPALEKITRNGAIFVDGQQQSYDAILLATGYKSNVPAWLKDDEGQFSTDGFPRSGWKCGRGLYVAGLSRNGLFGASRDAKCIAEDIGNAYGLQQQAFVSQTVRRS